MASAPLYNAPGMHAALEGYGSPATPTSGTPAPGTPPGMTSAQYQAALAADPNYIGYQQTSTADLANAATARKAAIRALVEQYGALPSGVTDTYGDLTPADLAAAAANPYSQEADLQRSYQANVLSNRKALAARGALHSGDLGFTQNQLDTTEGQNQSDLANNFTSSLQAAINNYLGTVNTENSNRQAAIQSAYQDMLQNPLYQGA